ncbi:MAG: hypothetical protein WAW59_07565 [Patescibacteria group bacterium]
MIASDDAEVAPCTRAIDASVDSGATDAPSRKDTSSEATGAPPERNVPPSVQVATVSVASVASPKAGISNPQISKDTSSEVVAV